MTSRPGIPGSLYTPGDLKERRKKLIGGKPPEDTLRKASP